MKLRKNKIQNKILLFLTGIIISGLFSCCINWSHVIEHNPLRTLEENIPVNERFNQFK